MGGMGGLNLGGLCLDGTMEQLCPWPFWLKSTCRFTHPPSHGQVFSVFRLGGWCNYAPPFVVAVSSSSSIVSLIRFFSRLTASRNYAAIFLRLITTVVVWRAWDISPFAKGSERAAALATFSCNYALVGRRRGHVESERESSIVLLDPPVDSQPK